MVELRIYRGPVEEPRARTAKESWVKAGEIDGELFARSVPGASIRFELSRFLHSMAEVEGK